MSDEIPVSLYPAGELVKQFHAEHSPLEAFLACIIDAQTELKSPPSRQIRIRDAFKALTDRDTNRIDDPSGKHSRALYRMAEYQYEEYVAQLIPEAGGPPDIDGELPFEEDSVSGFAERARLEFNLPEADEEILRRKFTGTYGRDARAKGEAYAALPIDRLNSFDAVAERQMLEDFRAIAIILERYRIKLEFDNVFWRVVGKLQEIAPNTK